ncbi:hypothetical protein I6E87_001850 [Enterococcus faecalis]|uniref:hypothetical protein n=1 Tax=Enterococcus faecalis TaxID=1351 RepID=UPI0019E01FE4|nr:hypothetical protein [Enterococcus faecalis]EGO8511778.1 hypothetical protein [Enterococcus faecalis]EGQ7428275.1 hypothetical protein [Enterococcus faecalis]MCU9783505.1 hypothetical protein [Enterococcus faecalis]MCU9795428.1 hypothetical protein [Enterococcus faecalis]MCU9797220.1 hypothetical protein [Enterococcus faecalis]
MKMYKKILKVSAILIFLFNICSVSSLYTYAEESAQIPKKILNDNVIKNALLDKTTVSSFNKKMKLIL